ncbi:helix-turn-helix transcriptional regulator [Ideonella oryzae]|uniref:AlpA family phage regulatory protein n=1 Tax=Ideonella oryzae TaxID=2937441 RepID=A0ABT1BKR1_9BURK|nr:AlpA family phage regulatory protein [Ideonella oryzae]MCO5976794.1 AlpA family phage regulatory protein [Ideonella oryzae]
MDGNALKRNLTLQSLAFAGNDDALVPGAWLDAQGGFSRSTRYALAARDPDFPKPIHLSTRCVRYRAGDVKQWLQAKAERAAQAQKGE